jgi:two-component system nitrogen regulation response regulator NtrX
MPPLRERGDDILLMLKYFTQRFQQEYRLKPMSFDHSASLALLRYSWPGNVRELRNFAERMIIMYEGQSITAAMLPPEILRTAALRAPQPAEPAPYAGLPAALRGNDFKNMRNAFEILYLRGKLQEFDGNISKMAEAIGLERSYLHRKLKSVNISE